MTVLHDSSDSYRVVDDSVQNKQYSRKIELVKLPYPCSQSLGNGANSGAEGGLVRGIGVVKAVS